MAVNSEDQTEGLSNRSAAIAVVIIFGLSCLGLFAVYLSFPEMRPEERPYVKLPTSLEDAKNLGRVLSNYTDKHFFTVLLAFFCTYIFLQSFAIPGSLFLSFLSGFLFPFLLAITLVCLCSAIGASLCYLISYNVGRRLVLHYIPDRVAEWKQQVAKQQGNMIYYIIFLRITPFLPNWFINITSPIVDVAIFPFFVGTFIGVAPPSILAIRAGTSLQQLASANVLFTWENILLLTGFAALSLVPVLFKTKLKSKFE
ncbi:transmembrane protein 41B-like [Tropilaelaps mercedesae]|uniref:Transmembrane protein 41B-like n=1 Tax=Tropilaelaps mercedesae TaxID=418985 RepID=A0A1V9XRI5_9ACAR|nr:transmembrane protein 41B-like [Tropilaelaps mercedesae]